MKTLEQLRTEDAQRYSATGTTVQIDGIDLSFRTIFLVVLKVVVSLCIIAVPVYVALTLLDVI
jgi:hypothetical protein